jgi:hypothetical protein
MYYLHSEGYRTHKRSVSMHRYSFSALKVTLFCINIHTQMRTGTLYYTFVSKQLDNLQTNGINTVFNTRIFISHQQLNKSGLYGFCSSRIK